MGGRVFALIAGSQFPKSYDGFRTFIDPTFLA